MQLADTGFPHDTEQAALFWLFPFPQDSLPDGWEIVADRDTPSVRTNERPYKCGRNLTTIIDGFVVSPNVRAISVQTRDLDFQFSDHQPVCAEFRRTD